MEKILKIFAKFNVSTHYLIGRKGEIYKLVEEKNTAYHAGKSSLPDGNRRVNECSIGIELANDSIEKPSKAKLN
ncbi:MAG TPA: N-acetylmuramoyl-L-alanine amidase [Flavobacterium sp.]|nr:N-acetylmuramoyl-L-alanine amidase [Flavobacterium sp.]